jgi:HSP20 family molecular chaperone IbpA
MQQPRRYVPRTDTRFNPHKMQLTAQLELPGVRRDDLSVSLSTCVWNRVRQVVVQGNVGERWKLLRDGGDEEQGLEERERSECTIIRERKYGDFRRSFAVPYETTVCGGNFLPLSLLLISLATNRSKM